MDPFVVWMTVAIGGLAAFTGFLIKWIIAHLESDLAYSRRNSERGADVAEKAIDVAGKT